MFRLTEGAWEQNITFGHNLQEDETMYIDTETLITAIYLVIDNWYLAGGLQ